MNVTHAWKKGGNLHWFKQILSFQTRCSNSGLMKYLFKVNTLPSRSLSPWRQTCYLVYLCSPVAILQWSNIRGTYLFQTRRFKQMWPCHTGKSTCPWLLLSRTTGLPGNSKSFIRVSSWLNQCLCMMHLWIANTCCLRAKQCFYLFAYFRFFNHCVECCESHLLTIICGSFTNGKVVWLMKSDTHQLLRHASRSGQRVPRLNPSLTSFTFNKVKGKGKCLEHELLQVLLRDSRMPPQLKNCR